MGSVKSQESSPTCGLGSLHSFALAQCSLNIDLNISTNTGLLLPNIISITCISSNARRGGVGGFQGKEGEERFLAPLQPVQQQRCTFNESLSNSKSFSFTNFDQDYLRRR